MQLTPNYRLMKPDGTDPVNVQDLNSNMDVLDEEVIKKLDKAGDASNVVNAFSQAGTRTNLTSGEKLSTSLGKLMKWFTDFAKVAFSGNYADLTGKPTIPAGGIADASKIMDNIDDIAANTQAGYMAGALALKKVNSDLAGMKWKKLGDYSGNGAIDISSCNADEYEVMIYSNAIPTVKLNIHLNKMELGNVLYAGFLYNDENFGSARIETTINSFKIGHLNINSKLSTDESNWRMSVYYK